MELPDLVQDVFTRAFEPPVAPTLELSPESHARQPARGSRWIARSSLGGAAAELLVSSVVFAGMSWSAWHDNQNSVERTSLDANSRFRNDTAWTAGFLISGLACAAGAFFLGRD
jgi:hypothetical protein